MTPDREGDVRERVKMMTDRSVEEIKKDLRERIASPGRARGGRKCVMLTTAEVEVIRAALDTPQTSGAVEAEASVVLSMKPAYERLLEDLESGEEVHVVGKITAPVQARSGEMKEAEALIVATPGCFYEDTIEAFLAAPQDADRQRRGGGMKERADMIQACAMFIGFCSLSAIVGQMLWDGVGEWTTFALMALVLASVVIGGITGWIEDGADPDPQERPQEEG